MTELQTWECWTLETMPEEVRAYIGGMPTWMQKEYLAQNSKTEIKEEMDAFYREDER